ncbi:MAG: hypothetical protein ACYS9Y_09365 [Planctomycetota bacterium]|jgi:hypothetical protein
MSKRKRKRPVYKTGRESSKETHTDPSMIEIEDFSKQQCYFEIFVVTVLFIFGIYQSILYFGHQLVPNPDFTGFVCTGRELLSFQLPSSFKRAPVLGILLVSLGNIVGGPYPELSAGWLLNAMLHPFSIVLLWLIGKRIVGRSALWVAILSLIEPWGILMLTHPLAETILLFFVLLTIYLIFKRSNWCYLCAAITTMVRYDGAALIVAAFVMDMICSQNRKERILSLVYSVIASIPLALWMLGTIMNFHNEGSSHYLKELGHGGALSKALIKSTETIWYTNYYRLSIPRPNSSKEAIELLLGLNKILVAASFISGVTYSFCKCQWKILILLIFFVLYTFVHSLHFYLIPRFCTTIHWIPMLICLYGLQSIWKLINKNQRVPKATIIGLQGVLLALVFVWWARLVPYLPKIAAISQRSASLPYVIMGIVIVVFIARRFIYKMRYSWRDLAISMLVCLMTVSNQFMLVRVLENGQKDMEFKILADWYTRNAQPGEKLISTMANIVSIFAPEHKDLMLHMGSIKAQNPDDFVRQCYEKNITYVVWDSRSGLNKGGRYYKLWNLNNTAMLAKPQSIGQYKYLSSIRINKRRYLNIFHLRQD